MNRDRLRKGSAARIGAKSQMAKAEPAKSRESARLQRDHGLGGARGFFGEPRCRVNKTSGKAKFQ